MPDLLDLVARHGLSPKRSGAQHGGEYSSGCPVCGDGGKGQSSDRFRIWPARHNEGLCVGRYWCRQCGAQGDTIKFLMDIDGHNFPSACAELGIALPGKASFTKHYQPPPIHRQPSSWTPNAYSEPSSAWQLKAENFLADCQKRLLENEKAMAWLEERGINRPMAERYGLGYNLSSKGKDRYRPRHLWGLPEKVESGKKKRLWLPRGWVISCRNATGELTQLRVRRRDEDIARFAERIKYLPIDGSSPAAMVLHPESEVFVIVESGFDAILLAGTMCGKIGAICTWNDAARPDARAHELLSRSVCILGALDYDHGGDAQQAWWQNQYRQYRRLAPLPGKAKDPGDAFAAGIDLRKWIIDGLPPGLRIKLGYTHKQSTQEKESPKKQAEKQPATDTEKEPSVIEIDVAGKTIYLTNDPDLWRELQESGKPVFSENELKRLQEATAKMTEDERIEAALKAIEVKETFGGYIRAGRSF